jgi:hypothetical protein
VRRRLAGHLSALLRRRNAPLCQILATQEVLSPFA